MAMLYYHYPRIAFRYPGLIRIVYMLNWLIQLRKWYVYPAIRNRLAQLEPGSTVADLGCGEGQFLLPFARRFPHLQFVALDNNPENIHFIQTFARRFGLTNVQPVCDTLTEYEPEQMIDFAWCVGVIHYIDDDQKAVQKMSAHREVLVYQPVNKKTETAFYRWTTRVFDNYDKQNHVYRIYTQGQLQNLFAERFDLIRSKQSYGKAGRLSHEYYTGITDLFFHGGYFIKPFALFAVLLCYPLILLGMFIDRWSDVQDGNGLLLHLKSKRV